jgi:uncharacterized protein YecE (DUF72 family)
VRTTDRGRVIADPGLERALCDEIAAAIAPLERAGKLACLLLQLTPAFSPRRNELDELDPILERFAPRPVAVELRNRGWVEEARLEATLEHLEDAGAVFVCVDGPPGDHKTIMPALDAVTRPEIAYLRAHGRNTEGYLKGRSVAERFDWRYSDEELAEIGGRVAGLAEEAGEVRVMFNNNASDLAPDAARRFRQRLGQDPGPPPAGDQLRLA